MIWLLALWVLASLAVMAYLRRCTAKEESCIPQELVARRCEGFHEWHAGDRIRPEPIGGDAGWRYYVHGGGEGLTGETPLLDDYLEACLRARECRHGRFRFLGLSPDGKVVLQQLGRTIEVSGQQLYEQETGPKAFDPRDFRFINLDRGKTSL